LRIKEQETRVTLQELDDDDDDDEKYLTSGGIEPPINQFIAPSLPRMSYTGSSHSIVHAVQRLLGFACSELPINSTGQIKLQFIKNGRIDPKEMVFLRSVTALHQKKMLTNTVAFTNSIRNLVSLHSSGLPTRICEVLVTKNGISQNPVTQKVYSLHTKMQ